jgi:hypothetical protein
MWAQRQTIIGAIGSLFRTPVVPTSRARSNFIPHYSTVPKLSLADAATHAARDLNQALQRPYPKTPFPMLLTRHIMVLKQLANIFRTVTAPTKMQPRNMATHKAPTPVPRVATPDPRVMAKQPHNPTEHFQPWPPTHRYST